MKLMVENILLVTIVSILLTYFINKIFSYHKTSYILIASIFMFLSVSVLFLHLELEFLAITFSMVYVGGIVVMFLFLIMTVDVNIQNVEGTRIVEQSKIICIIIPTISLLLNILIFSNMDVFLFNTVDFLNYLDECIELSWNWRHDFLIDSLQDQLFLIESVDLWSLGVTLYKSFFVLLILVAIFLFLALIVSLIFSSNLFEKYWNIKI